MHAKKIARWLALPAVLGFADIAAAQTSTKSGASGRSGNPPTANTARSTGPRLVEPPTLFRGLPLPPEKQILEVPTGTEERYTVAPYRLVAEPYSTRRDVVEVKIPAVGADEKEPQAQLPQLITINGKAMGEAVVVLPLVNEATGETFERRLPVLVIDQISPAFRDHMVNTIRRVFPSTNVDVVVMNGRTVLLTGQVDRAELVSVIEDFVRSSLAALQMRSGQGGGGGPGQQGGANVVNAMRVVDAMQVQLKVVFASVNRTKLRDLGLNWRWEDLSGPVSGNLAMQIPGNPTTGASLPFFVTRAGVFSYLGFLQALETNGLGKILAEPSLVAMSGAPAFFNAGQQFPIVSPGSTVLGGAGSGGQLGGGSVTFVPIGTNLRFVPTVLGNGRIRLEVRPEVSEFIREVATPGGGTAPVISQRVAETTVELESGQTFVLAGLTRQQASSEVNKLPILGNMPIFGWAFQQKNYDQQEEELVIMVTPYFVDALDERPCKLPGRESRIPNDVEFYLGSKFEPPCFQDPYVGDWKKNWQPPVVKAVPPYDNHGKADESFLAPNVYKPFMQPPRPAGATEGSVIVAPPTAVETQVAPPVMPRKQDAPEKSAPAKDRTPPAAPSKAKATDVKKAGMTLPTRSRMQMGGDDLMLPASEAEEGGRRNVRRSVEPAVEVEESETQGWQKHGDAAPTRSSGRARRDQMAKRVSAAGGSAGGRVVSLIPKDEAETPSKEMGDGLAEEESWKPAKRK